MSGGNSTSKDSEPWSLLNYEKVPVPYQDYYRMLTSEETDQAGTSQQKQEQPAYIYKNLPKGHPSQGVANQNGFEFLAYLEDNKSTAWLCIEWKCPVRIYVDADSFKILKIIDNHNHEPRFNEDRRYRKNRFYPMLKTRFAAMMETKKSGQPQPSQQAKNDIEVIDLSDDDDQPTTSNPSEQPAQNFVVANCGPTRENSSAGKGSEIGEKSTKHVFSASPMTDSNGSEELPIRSDSKKFPISSEVATDTSCTTDFESGSDYYEGPAAKKSCMDPSFARPPPISPKTTTNISGTVEKVNVDFSKLTENPKESLATVLRKVPKKIRCDTTVLKQCFKEISKSQILNNFEKSSEPCVVGKNLNESLQSTSITPESDQLVRANPETDPGTGALSLRSARWKPTKIASIKDTEDEFARNWLRESDYDIFGTVKGEKFRISSILKDFDAIFWNCCADGCQAGVFTDSKDFKINRKVFRHNHKAVSYDPHPDLLKPTHTLLFEGFLNRIKKYEEIKERASSDKNFPDGPQLINMKQVSPVATFPNENAERVYQSTSQEANNLSNESNSTSKPIDLNRTSPGKAEKVTWLNLAIEKKKNEKSKFPKNSHRESTSALLDSNNLDRANPTKIGRVAWRNLAERKKKNKPPKIKENWAQESDHNIIGTIYRNRYRISRIAKDFEMITWNCCVAGCAAWINTDSEGRKIIKDYRTHKHEKVLSPDPQSRRREMRIVDTVLFDGLQERIKSYEKNKNDNTSFHLPQEDGNPNLDEPSSSSDSAERGTAGHVRTARAPLTLNEMVADANINGTLNGYLYRLDRIVEGKLFWNCNYTMCSGAVITGAEHYELEDEIDGHDHPATVLRTNDFRMKMCDPAALNKILQKVREEEIAPQPQ